MADPEPEYYAVIFSSIRRPDDPEGYGLAAERMLELAAAQPGFLGVESVRNESGEGITVSYWKDRASISAWRDHAEHALARKEGRERWYETFRLRICSVESEYGIPEMPGSRDFLYIPSS